MEVNTINIDRFELNSEENMETIIKFKEIEYDDNHSQEVTNKSPCSSNLTAERVQEMLNAHYQKIENLLSNYDAEQKKRHEQTLQMLQ